MIFKSTIFYFLLAVSIFILEGCNTKEQAPREGFIEVTGGKVWYRINGTGSKPPILLLHGGPGSSSYYLDPLIPLSKDRPVIFIDQLGCGRSTRITDTTLMTIEHYVEEVEQVRKALHLENFYLYGHSWGTMLALDYYLKYPNEVKAILFHSPLFSTDRWIKDADTLIAALPDSIQMAIRLNEKSKTFGNADYQKAMEVFYGNFYVRMGRSQSQLDSIKMFDGTNVYTFMWGPSEFTATGNLLHYERLKNLAEIRVPTLLLTGEYDEARPTTVRYFQSLIPGSEFVIVKKAGHQTMYDNPQETIEAISPFLLKND